MEKQIFKLNNKDEEFVPIEVSDEMKDFLETYEEQVLSSETEDYKIYYTDSILEALRESASFERDSYGGMMGEYGSIFHLFKEREDVIIQKDCDFVGIKK